MNKVLRKLCIVFIKMKAGDTKDKALQKAKLTYCENSVLSKNHPFYWATFAQSGNKMALF